MIDIDLIRKEPDRVRDALLKRMDQLDLEEILEVDRRRRELRSALEAMQARRNQTAREVGQRKARGEETAELERAASALRDEIASAEAAVAAVEEALQRLLEQLPNLPDDRVPAGGKEANQVVRVFGEKPAPVSRPLDHVELCTRLGLIDYERGAKLGGNGFWLYTGQGAALEWALLDFFCRQHVADGYRFLLPPHLLADECGYTAGQFPKFRDDVFHLETRPGERSRFLLPTAETAILNVYREETIAFDDLPIKAFAYTPCYRREAGSHRTEERGSIRGHQFNKVEMFQFVAPEQVEAALAELVRKSESLVEQLGLHYRTSLLAARDASAAMALTYDIEVWIPSIQQYKEVSSASWARDYQARRAGLRFKRGKGQKSEFIHTLNASGLATSRLLPAIVEQCQEEDGSVRVPEPLRAWVGTDVIRPPR